MFKTNFAQQLMNHVAHGTSGVDPRNELRNHSKPCVHADALCSLYFILIASILTESAEKQYLCEGGLNIRPRTILEQQSQQPKYVLQLFAWRDFNHTYIHIHNTSLDQTQNKQHKFFLRNNLDYNMNLVFVNRWHGRKH